MRVKMRLIDYRQFPGSYNWVRAHRLMMIWYPDGAPFHRKEVEQRLFDEGTFTQRQAHTSYIHIYRLGMMGKESDKPLMELGPGPEDIGKGRQATAHRVLRAKLQGMRFTREEAIWILMDELDITHEEARSSYNTLYYKSVVFTPPGAEY